MNAVATVIDIDFSTESQPVTPAALGRSVKALTNLFGHCERLHRANIEHDPHSCVVCFETR
ncbi:MAG: hypothetical protein JWQ32_2966 [Marmoricola sp.]|nr:hypothetical protein [Marmoricola sp.]